MSDITLKIVEELSQSETVDLVQFARTSYFATVCKLLEMEVIAARDTAMAVDPADTKLQIARMTEAHALAKGYTRFRKLIENLATEHFNEVKLAAQQQELQDQDNLEALILADAAGQSFTR